MKSIFIQESHIHHQCDGPSKRGNLDNQKWFHILLSGLCFSIKKQLEILYSTGWKTTKRGAMFVFMFVHDFTLG